MLSFYLYLPSLIFAVAYAAELDKELKPYGKD